MSQGESRSMGWGKCKMTKKVGFKVALGVGLGISIEVAT